MLPIPGQREGTWRYMYDGFEFHKTPRYINRYHCASRSAADPCRMYIIFEGNQILRIRGDHNHERPTLSIRGPAIRELKRRCLETDMPAREIVDTVFRDFPEVINVMTSDSARQIIYHTRAQQRLAQ